MVLLYVFVVVFCLWSIVFFFFFQAEDGIRDAQESRGLGDVYKRQDKNSTEQTMIKIETTFKLVLLMLILSFLFDIQSCNSRHKPPAIAKDGLALLFSQVFCFFHQFQQVFRF